MRLLLLLLLNVFLSASVTAQTPKESTCFSFPAIIGANCNGEVKQVSVIRHPVVKDACKRPGYNFKYLWIFKRTSGEQSRLYSDGVMTVEIPVNTDSVEFCYWLEVNGSQITPMISAINVIAVDQIQCNTCSDSTNITVKDSVIYNFVSKDSTIVTVKDSVVIHRIDSVIYTKVYNFYTKDTIIYNTVFKDTVLQRDSIIYNVRTEDVCLEPYYIINTNGCDTVKCDIQVYPNPSDGDFKIDVRTSDHIYEIDLKIYNMVGNLVYKDHSGEIGFRNLYTFDIWLMDAGFYPVEITIKARNVLGLDKEYYFSTKVVVAK